MPCVAELLAGAFDQGGQDARRDAEILLCHCLTKPRVWLYTWPETQVADEQLRQFEALLSARREGQPIAYLTGRREFWSLNLQVNQHTLIPRPETETLVEWALELALPVEAKVLDLGTGSGAIALAVASERPQWQVTAVDNSEHALQVARHNSVELGLDRVQFYRSDWYQNLAGQRYHLLLSNPPYVEEGDAHLASGDLRYEPVVALVAGDAGMADLSCLVSDAPAHLYEGGWLLLEHGHTQGEAVRNILAEKGFCDIHSRRDMAGLDRITGGRWGVE